MISRIGSRRYPSRLRIAHADWPHAGRVFPILGGRRKPEEICVALTRQRTATKGDDAANGFTLVSPIGDRMLRVKKAVFPRKYDPPGSTELLVVMHGINHRTHTRRYPESLQERVDGLVERGMF